LKEFDQVIRVTADPTSTEMVWRLSPWTDYSDFTLDLRPDIATGAEAPPVSTTCLRRRHTIMMFDRNADGAPGRSIPC
jgi:hypothetical protein